MFSITPSTGTLTFSNIVDALRASISATSCGVVTMIAPAERDRLHDRQLDVAGAGREIEHEVIEFAPFDLPQKLLRVTRHHRPAQDRRRSVVEQETHRHQLEVVLLDRDDLVLFRRGRPIARAEHERDARAVDVAIAEADARFVCSSAMARFAATVDLPTPPLPLATAITCLMPSIRVAPTPAAPAPAGGAWISIRTFGLSDTRQLLQSRFRVRFDRARDRRLVRRERQLHRDGAVGDLDSFDQPERDDVAAETRILYRRERCFDLFFGDGHDVGREATRGRLPGKEAMPADSPPLVSAAGIEPPNPTTN